MGLMGGAWGLAEGTWLLRTVFLLQSLGLGSPKEFLHSHGGALSAEFSSRQRCPRRPERLLKKSVTEIVSHFGGFPPPARPPRSLALSARV